MTPRQPPLQRSEPPAGFQGVLLVNLGTPTSYRWLDVWRYLNEFLTDPRVIDLPWLQRQLLVKGLIVPARCRQSARQYAQVWTEQGSPLMVHGRAVKAQLQALLGERFKVALAMRYQSPSIAEGLDELREAERLIILPLFPHYASATVGSIHQKVMQVVSRWPVIPPLTLVSDYFDHPLLIAAFCARAQQYPLHDYDHILFSFHGLPERHVRRASPQSSCLSATCCRAVRADNRFCYRAQCYATARAIAAGLDLPPARYSVCFQSRLGKEPWLQPYLSDQLPACVRQGWRRVLVFSPSFVCDCLETSYEIGYEGAHQFSLMGGTALQLVEGLNSHPLWIEALGSIVRSSASGRRQC